MESFPDGRKPGTCLKHVPWLGYTQSPRSDRHHTWVICSFMSFSSVRAIKYNLSQHFSQSLIIYFAALHPSYFAMYTRAWKSLNSHAHGPADTDPYARHIPVGRVLAERTASAPLTEVDRANMYAGSFVFAPGPCAYDGESMGGTLVPDLLLLR